MRVGIYVTQPLTVIKPKNAITMMLIIVGFPPQLFGSNVTSPVTAVTGVMVSKMMMEAISFIFYHTTPASPARRSRVGVKANVRNGFNHISLVHSRNRCQDPTAQTDLWSTPSLSVYLS